MWEGGKSFATIIIGILFMAIGIVPVLSYLKIFSLTIPEIPNIILFIVMATASFYLIIDGFFELGMHPALAWTSIFIGVLFITVSIISLFSNIFSFLTPIWIFSIYVVLGFLLFFAGFMF